LRYPSLSSAIRYQHTARRHPHPAESGITPQPAVPDAHSPFTGPRTSRPGHTRPLGNSTRVTCRA
ncbi:hypothetical protein CALCODRAFT_493441, partial [Calocera cornea HHB12733]